jgi:uncharacterized protein (DUF2141 family)
MVRVLRSSAVGLAARSAPAFAQDATGTLTFEPGAPTGSVMVALYDSPAAYAGGRPVGQMQLDASVGPAVAVFRDLPAGEYAAKAFHDVDGDGEMDTNPFGIPIEPYAFSNNAVGAMGPASWDRARFTVAGDTAQTIRLR